MNENFTAYFRKKSESVYTVSKQTGIPYTSLSELVNGKTDINKCAAGMVFRLSLYFKCNVKDLLNQEPLITNVSGTYRKIKYKWMAGKTPDHVQLHVWDHDCETILDEGMYSQPRFYHAYTDLTEAIIDYYLQQKQAEGMLND